MPKQNAEILTFNRGIIDKRALSRIDIERVRASCELMTNYLPSVMGATSLRQGTQYITSTRGNNPVQVIPFIYSENDNAIIEFAPAFYRVIIEDQPLTRPTVSTTITNGTFASNLSGWTDASEGSATVIYSSFFGGSARFLGASNGDRAILKQTLTVATDDINVEHGFYLSVPRSQVTIRFGSSDGASDYFLGEGLKEGFHSISVTPTGGSIFIQIESDVDYFTYISDISIEVGEVSIETPYTTASNTLGKIQYDQSYDVVYLATQNNIAPRKIIRRAPRTWSLEKYEPNDGPFLTQNISSTKMTISGTAGNETITASNPVFFESHIGSLITISPPGQTVFEDISSDDTFGDFIEIEGVSNARAFTIQITGTWVATVTLQRSYDEGISWEDVNTYTSNVLTSFNDGFDNVTILYRIGVKSGDYTSGTATVALSYPRGSTRGIFRITGFTSETSVSCEVLQSPKSRTSTDVWALGAFSERNGYPSAVSLHEGRLFLATDNFLYGSVSDAYESFDEEISGASSPIVRVINRGPAYWLASLNRLIIGQQNGQEELRSSSFDEPLTNDESTVKKVSTVKTSNIPPIIIDRNGIFISGNRVFELTYSSESFGYVENDLTLLTPKIGDSGFVALGVSRSPETNVHCVRGDGKVAILSYDPTENLRGWSLYETDGQVENVVVLPDDTSNQDQIYYVVRRVVDGSVVRYYEKWANRDECVGGNINKNLDCFITGSSSARVINGLSHLEGKTVYVWADGEDLGSFIVENGAINLGQSVSNYIVGLGYTAQYKSVKLPYAAGLGTGLTQNKSVQTIGFNLVNTHIGGFMFGPDFTTMDNLPLTYKHMPQNENTIFEEYDDIMGGFPSINDSDARLCIQGVANRPHTITAIILGIQTNDKG